MNRIVLVMAATVAVASAAGARVASAASGREPAPRASAGTPALAITIRRAEAEKGKTTSRGGAAFGAVRRVVALDRNVPQKAIQETVSLRVFPGRREGPGERWVWDRLPAGVYDLMIETENGGRFEGADLRPDAPVQRPLSERDRKTIRKKFAAMRTWSDRKRIVRLEGHGEQALALVELLRTKPTSLKTKRPFVVWRMEVWSYRNRYGAWRRDDTPRAILRRFRVDREAFASWRWNFLPSLGGVDVDPARAPAKRTVTVPASFHPAAGPAGRPVGVAPPQ